MADYLTTDTDLISVADAIRAKGGTSAALEWPSGYVDAVDAIPTGITPTGTISITQNGTYDVTDYASASVNVSGGGGSDADYIACIERSTNTPTLPSGLTKISDHAFYSWTNLALTSLPSGVTSIGNYSFSKCTKLALTSLPSGVTSIGNDTFNGCTKLALTSLPSGVTKIGSSAFSGCTGLTSISCTGALGSSGLGASAFTGCTNLTSAMFPNATQSSLSTVFGYTTASKACKKLEVADVGKTSAISASAFANCYALQTLILRKTGAVCTLSNVSAFLNTPMRGYNSLTGTVYVPNALIASYKTATNWKTLYDGGTLTFAAIEGSQYEL